jgi:hypothetical protein
VTNKSLRKREPDWSNIKVGSRQPRPDPKADQRQQTRVLASDRDDGRAANWDRAPAFERHMLRGAYVEFVRSLEPNLMLTFNFGYTVGSITAQSSITEFFQRIQKKGLGRNWYRLSADLRPRAVGFREHDRSNAHYHVLVNVDGPVALAILNDGKRVWATLQPWGQFHLEVIRRLGDAISYCTKELALPNRLADVFVYAPKPRAG